MSLKGDIQIAPQEVLTASSTQLTDIGARATTGDGRIFRYVLNGTTAMIAGKVYQGAAQDSTNFQGLGVLTASGTSTTAVTTGSTVTLTSNQLAGGLLSVRSGSGAGIQYKVKSHPAITSGTVTFTLEDPLVVALATTSIIDVTPNLFNGVLKTPTTLTAAPAGVAVYAIPASQYGWLQTRGNAVAYVDGSTTVGYPLAISTGTAGAFVNSSGTSSAVFAVPTITTSGTVFAPVSLMFE